MQPSMYYATCFNAGPLIGPGMPVILTGNFCFWRAKNCPFWTTLYNSSPFRTILDGYSFKMMGNLKILAMASGGTRIFCGGIEGGKMRFWGGKNPKICRKWLILAFFFLLSGGGHRGGQNVILRGQKSKNLPEMTDFGHFFPSEWGGQVGAEGPPWCHHWLRPCFSV